MDIRSLGIFPLVLLLFVTPVSSGEDPDTENDMPPAISSGSGSFFVENLGQWNDEILFMSSFGDSHIALGDRSILIDIPEDNYDGIKRGRVVRYDLLGADSVKPAGLDRIHGSFNYFPGRDPSGWVSGARAYRQVVYEEVYGGIDMVCYFSAEGFKYEFHLSPGSDPLDIGFHISGIEDLKTYDGGIRMEVPKMGPIYDGGLCAFYSDDKGELEVRTRMMGDRSFGYDIENPEPGKDYIIDPLIYSTYLGGSENDQSHGLEVDRSGCAYLVSHSGGGGFPTTPGAYSTDSHLGAYVTKMASNGSSIEYSTFLGTVHNYECDIHVKDGFAYVTGTTKSDDFPTTSGAFQRDIAGNDGWRDLFVTKLDRTGSSLVYSTLMGGSQKDQSFDICLDSGSNAVVCGRTHSSDFNVTPDAMDGTLSGSRDGFILKLNSDGSDLLYSSYIGGSGEDEALRCHVDENGHIFVTGWTLSQNFPVTSEAYDTEYNWGQDVFLTKLDPGLDPIYSTYLGGNGHETVYGLDVDGNGNVFLSGETGSSEFPTTSSALSDSLKGTGDIFLSQVSSDGSKLLYSSYIGGYGSDGEAMVRIDGGSKLIICGYTTSNDFPLTPDAYDDVMVYHGKVCLMVLNRSDMSLMYSTLFGGSNIDHPHSMAVLNGTDIFFTGLTQSNDYPTTEDAFSNVTNGGYCDSFVTRFRIPGPPHPPINLTGELSFESLYLDWDPPEGDVGSAITDYIVYRGLDEESISYLGRTDLDTHYTDERVVNGVNYYYQIRAENRMGISCPSATYYLDDCICPCLVEDRSSGSATTGDPFDFYLEVSDNTKTTDVRVNYRFGDSEIRNITMEGGSGSVWASTIMVPHDISRSLNYTFSGCDAYGNWFLSNKTEIRVRDNDPPMMEEDLTPERARSDHDLPFRIRVRDNIEVSAVFVSYGINQEDTEEETLTSDDGENWTGSIHLGDTLGSIRYSVVVEDTSGNVNETDPRELSIVDKTPPSISDIVLPRKASAGDDIEVKAMVSDNSWVSDVYVEYGFGEGMVHNETMERSGEYMLTISTSSRSLDPLHIKVIAGDDSGNWAVSEEYTVIMEDDIPPDLVMNDPPATGKTGTGKTFVVGGEVYDNIRLANITLEYGFGDGPVIRRYLDTMGDFDFYIEVPMDSLEPLHYRVICIDDFGNRAESENMTVSVTDIVPPVVRGIEDKTIAAGELLNINLSIRDNIGLESVVWSSRFDVSGESWSLRIDKAGTYVFRVTATDNAGNEITEEFTVYVEGDVSGGTSDKAEGIPVGLITAAVAAAVLVLILAVIVILITRRKKEEPPEEPVQETPEPEKEPPHEATPEELYHVDSFMGDIGTGELDSELADMFVEREK